ncbi:MAG: hypothetical protein ACRDRM_05840 [Pseudonocardiaceae bacterium]
MLVFAALPVACLLRNRLLVRVLRPQGWGCLLRRHRHCVFVGFVPFGMGFSRDPTLMPIGCLLQRLTIIVGWAWLTAPALHLLRRACEIS